MSEAVKVNKPDWEEQLFVDPMPREMSPIIKQIQQKMTDTNMKSFKKKRARIRWISSVTAACVLLFSLIVGQKEPLLNFIRGSDPNITKTTTIIYENTTHNFTLELPYTWERKYEVVENVNEDPRTTNLNFIDKANKVYGGVIFTITIWTKEGWATDGPSAIDVGRIYKIGEDEDKVFTLSPPGDVEYNHQDEKLTAEYLLMSDQINNIKNSFKLIPTNSKDDPNPKVPTKEDDSIRAIGTDTEGRLIVKPADQASVAPLGAPSCYGLENDLHWLGEYEAVWESKSNGVSSKVMTFPIDFEIVQPNDTPIMMQQFSLGDTRLFAYVPRYTDCHSLETYFFGVSTIESKAFPISFEMKPDQILTNINQLPHRQFQVSNGELILTGGYGAGQDFINVYHFRYDSKKRSMILQSTDQVKPNEVIYDQ